MGKLSVVKLLTVCVLFDVPLCAGECEAIALTLHSACLISRLVEW